MNYTLNQTDGGELPEYLAYLNDTNQLQFSGEYPDDASGNEVTLELTYTAYFDVFGVNHDSIDVEVTIVKPEAPLEVVIAAGPSFVTNLSTQSVATGAAWLYTLPEVTDDTAPAESVTIDVDVGAAVFVTYDGETKTFTIIEGATIDIVDVTYPIKITLTNELGNSNNDEFSLEVGVPDEEEEEEDNTASTEDSDTSGFSFTPEFEAPRWVPPTVSG